MTRFMAPSPFMFNALRQRTRRRLLAEDGHARPRDAQLQLRLPNPYGGKPWLTATVAVSSTPHGHGERLRLRAHVDGCLRLPETHGAQPSLGHGPPTRASLARYGRRAAASLARRLVERLPTERLQPLAAQRWRSWLDVQLSTSPLDGGANALMPEPLRGIYGGELPRAGSGEPRVGVWSGPAGGPAGGIAYLAMLQLDERDIGAHRDRRSDPGFNLNASLAQLVEPDLGTDD